MNKQVAKFLEFNGKSLLFLAKDGVCWIALKPVCEAITVDYIQQFKNVSDDPILGPALCKHTMQVPGDQARSMVCLPESLIYGWIFSIKSNSPDLVEYKRECYKVLFDFFHGTITNRRDLLREKAIIQRERAALEIKLRGDDAFVKFEELKAKEARIGISLKQIDNQEFKSQLQLFADEN